MKNQNTQTAKLSDALVWVKQAMSKFTEEGLSPEEKSKRAEQLKLVSLASQTVVNTCNVIARVCQVTGSKDEAKNILGDL